jgi:hypothetical protein
VLIAACLALILPSAAPAAPGKGKPPAAADTTLARVGSRIVSLRLFREAYTRAYPKADPDSLTPQGRRRFLQLLVDKEVLAQRALADPPPLSAAQQADLDAMRDRMVIGVLLDSVIGPYVERERQAARAAGSADTSRRSLIDRAQIALRDTLMSRLGAHYEEQTVARVLPAFRALPVPKPGSSYAAQLRDRSAMPQVDPADTLLALAWVPGDTATVAELLRHWRRISPFYRPRIESADQIKALAGNAIVERRLRREASAARLDQRPSIAGPLADRREFFLVSQYVDRQVWSEVPRDSVTLRRYFDRDPAAWIVPAHARALRLSARSQPEAESLAAVLRDPVRADSLLAQGQRAGAEIVLTVSATDDSARYAEMRAAGVGAVVGPYVDVPMLTVARVLELVPPRPRSFAEARPLVLKAWTERDGEHRMRELLRDLRRRTKVWIHPDWR